MRNIFAKAYLYFVLCKRLHYNMLYNILLFVRVLPFYKLLLRRLMAFETNNYTVFSVKMENS